MSAPFVKIYGSEHGTGFFAAPQYIVTCRHIIKKYEVGETVEFRFDSEEEKYEAEIVAVLEEDSDDLALLKSPIKVKAHYFLDRIAVQGRGAKLTGYPHDVESYETAHIILGDLNGNGDKLKLEKANDIAEGYSGGPVCPENDEKSVVGICAEFINTDEDDREQNIACAVPASKVLDAWGDYVCEKRYTPQGKDRHPHNDFVYQALKTDFIGRTDEMELLRDFMQHDNDCRLFWQAVVAPGGSGKSRLAYELANRLDSTWHCQLVRQDELTVSNLNKIYEEAARNLLLIADYAYTDTNELGKWIGNILQTSPKHDIRILLLQRQESTKHDKAKWLETLEKSDGNIDEFMYSDELPITPLNEKEIHGVMKSYAQNKGVANMFDSKACHALYETLKRVDPELLRPLFAIFIADAYIENPDEPLNWKRNDALKHFSERELNIIKNTNLNKNLKKAAHLLTVLATITGGCSFEDGKLPDLKEIKKIKDDIGDELEEVGLAVKRKDTYTVEAITPDLLGEYFVKMYFEEHQDDIPEILEATRNSNDLATSDFLIRLFTDHEADIDFIDKCCDYKNSDNVSWGLIRRADVDKLASMYERYKGSDNESFWVEQYSKGLFNCLCRKDCYYSKSEEILGKLRKLYEDNRESMKIAVEYAKGLYNYFNSYRLISILMSLKRLYEENKEDKDITVLYASGLFNHLNHKFVLSSTTRRLDARRAKETLEMLREMYEDNNENTRVAELYAKGLVVYFNYPISADEAKNALKELKKLKKDIMGNTEVTILCIKMLFNQLNIQTNAKEADTILEMLKELYEDNKGNLEVTEIYAEGLLNHVNKQTKAKEAKKILKMLKEMHEDNKGNVKLTMLYAKGLVIYFKYPMGIEEIEKALKELSRLHEIEKKNEVTIQYAKGLNYCISKISVASKKTINFLETLKKLYKDNKKNSELAELYACGLYKHIDSQIHTEKVKEFIEMLRILYEDNSENTEIAEVYANGLVNYFNQSIRAKEAKKTVCKLRDLYNNNKNNEEIAVKYAEGIVEYVIGYVNSEKEANKYLNILKSLKKNFTQDYGFFDQIKIIENGIQYVHYAI